MKLNGVARRILMHVFGLFPIKKKIVFSSFLGKRYGGNPKDIYEYIKNQDDEIEYIWLLDNNHQIEGAKTIPYLSIRALYHLATARVWIDDVRKWRWAIKRKSQFYIQTWHGAGPCLKKIELDAQDSLESYYVKALINDSKQADLMISECKWRTENIRKAFAYKGEILLCRPTIVRYISESDALRKRVRQAFNIPLETKILLYAPTFRNDETLLVYDLNTEAVANTLRKRDKAEWCVVVRLHPSLSEKQNVIQYSNILVNGTNYESFEELLVASDAFITDYSATLFQALYMEKETYVYAKDYEEYIKKNRDLYFNLNELPVKIAKSNDEIIRYIKGYPNEKANIYMKMKLFNESLGYYDNYPDLINVLTHRMRKELKV